MSTLITSIVQNIRNDEIGDVFESRIEHVIHTICNNVIVVGDKSTISEHYRDYRCWNKFPIDQQHSWYEYTRWMGSCLDLADNNVGKDLLLMGKLKLEVNINMIMHAILPNLKYQVLGDLLLITLDSIEIGTLPPPPPNLTLPPILGTQLPLIKFPPVRQ